MDEKTEIVNDYSKSGSAAFKLSTLRTLAADPQMKPIDVRLFTAYSHFMTWPKRHAFLSNIKARAMTGNTAQATISASRARLLKHGYLVKVMDRFNGSILFQLSNPRQEIIEDSIKISEEKLKEWDADRKERDRRKAKAKAKGASNIVTLEVDEGNKKCTDRVTKIGDNSLEYSLNHRATKEQVNSANDLTNPYARAKAGG